MNLSSNLKLRYEKCLGIWGNANLCFVCNRWQTITSLVESDFDKSLLPLKSSIPATPLSSLWASWQLSDAALFSVVVVAAAVLFLLQRAVYLCLPNKTCFFSWCYLA